jgi:hypothetical protein
LEQERKILTEAAKAKAELAETRLNFKTEELEKRIAES